jgi:hypothetical protein
MTDDQADKIVEQLEYLNETIEKTGRLIAAAVLHQAHSESPAATLYELDHLDG